mmetsp:Transcript_109176/g.295971  ORF Transcript_109176/g.295971 Transcript_109176/m.295971 type:complete len:211 (-) Transcript_109176:13-645(-)
MCALLLSADRTPARLPEAAFRSSRSSQPTGSAVHPATPGDAVPCSRPSRSTASAGRMPPRPAAASPRSARPAARVSRRSARTPHRVAVCTVTLTGPLAMSWRSWTSRDAGPCSTATSREPASWKATNAKPRLLRDLASTIRLTLSTLQPSCWKRRFRLSSSAAALETFDLLRPETWALKVGAIAGAAVCQCPPGARSDAWLEPGTAAPGA